MPSSDSPIAHSSESSPAQAGRIYSGQGPSQRALERHGRLINAGIELFGTVGYPATKIKMLCQSAGLSERYFYESFGSREDLLASVYDHLAGQLLEQTNSAVHMRGASLQEAVRGGMAAVVNFMLDDPRHAQIILVEIVGVSAKFEDQRHRSIRQFSAESQRLLLLLAGVDPVEAEPATKNVDHPLAEAVEFARLTGSSIVGGVNNMLLDALRDGTTDNTARITEAAFQLIRHASLGVRALASK